MMMRDPGIEPITGSAEGGVAPPTPLPAATIALVRDGESGTEVLLLRRPPHSSFAPDNWVFPGGRVDAADFELDHDAIADGPSARAWARILQIDDVREASAYVVAAVRETWEETGILLAHGTRDAVVRESARLAMLAGGASLRDHLERFSLRLATEKLRYIGHWITPEWLPRRFDTRFFQTRVDREAICMLHGDEITEYRWIAPLAALRAASAGEIKLLPPTLHTLRLIGESLSADASKF
jgi:8-oxo-dGTP pyrophosphatase MutT (NUDIX family)